MDPLFAFGIDSINVVPFARLLSYNDSIKLRD
jgi:hypothetical protein